MTSHAVSPDPLPLVAAVVAYFLVGWLWHGPLFGKTWARLMGIPMDRKPTGAEMGKSLGLGLLATVLILAVFAWVVEAVAGPDETVGSALEGAGWVWLGFFLPQQIGAVAWERRPWALAGLNAAYALVALAVAAVVYAVVP